MPTFYAQTIFAKPLDQITEADLTSYFQQERDETLNLEFKSGARSSDTKGVLKSITAFLNSSGGLLIWGAPESVEIKRGEKKVKVCRGPLAPVQEELSRDSFFDKIAGNVSPVPVGVRMHPVPIAIGGYVYLFDVPESQNKPHQTDGRYYVRMDTRTDTAPHYLVYALCHQIKTPVLKLEIVGVGEGYMNLYGPRLPTVRVDVSISNETPFIHDENVYFIAKSGSMRFDILPRDSIFDYQFRKDDVSKLLPFGLTATFHFNIQFDEGFEDREHKFSVWYGGSRSTVTEATFALTGSPSHTIGEQQLYRIDIKLIGETGLSRTQEFAG